MHPSYAQKEREKEVRELVERHGYKLRRRGKEYQTIDEEGEVRSGGDLDTIAGWFEMLATAKANGQHIEVYKDLLLLAQQVGAGLCHVPVRL